MDWLLENLGLILSVTVAFVGAFLAAFWVSLVIWTFRDIRSRTRDVFAHLLATLMVMVFGPLGLFLYFILRPRETLIEAYERSLEEEALLQDIEERPVCPGCKQLVREDYLICPNCHTKLKKRCPNCGRLLHLRWNICPYCGATPALATATPTPALAVASAAASPTASGSESWSQAETRLHDAEAPTRRISRPIPAPASDAESPPQPPPEGDS